MKRLLLALILCAPAWGANVFSGDPNCVAVYRFESGALTTDSQGSNTLTMAYGYSTPPQEETSDYQEGACCTDLERSHVQHFYRTDANLPNDFPGKNGQTTYGVSVVGYIKLEATTNGQPVATKSGWQNKKGWNLTVLNFSSTGYAPKLLWAISPTGTDYSQGVYWPTQIQTGTWYHVAATFNNTTYAWTLDVWDVDANQRLGGGDPNSGTFGSPLNIDDGELGVGGDRSISSNPLSYYALDGLLDEVAIFNDVLTADEITAIRSETYAGGASDTGTTNWWWRRRHNK